MHASMQVAAVCLKSDNLTNAGYYINLVSKMKIWISSMLVGFGVTLKEYF